MAAYECSLAARPHAHWHRSEGKPRAIGNWLFVTLSTEDVTPFGVLIPSLGSTGLKKRVW